MTDKEIGELRRRFAPEKNNITTLCGRYINEKHETIAEFTTPFFLLPDDVSEKYLSIFRRTLGGGNRRNLLDIGFSTSQVENSEEHSMLMKLRDSQCKDENLVSDFFDKISLSLDIEGNNLILLISDSYDVPIKHRDEGGDGESDSIFRYILCAVCPVKEAPSTLSYDAGGKSFTARSCVWNVGAPEAGFLFPAFDCRKTNIYNALYYVKSTSDNHEALAQSIFNTELPLPADEQKQIFESLLGNTLEDECSYEVVQAVHDDIATKIEEHKALQNPEPLSISKQAVTSLLSDLGVSDEKVERFGERYDEEYGVGTDLSPKNIVEVKKLEIKTPDVQIKINSERGDLVETRVIDGVKYILIRADENITVNGVNISIVPDK